MEIHEESSNSVSLELSDIWLRPGYLVRRLHQIHWALFANLVANGTVTPIQFGLLSILKSRPGIDQSQLGESLGIDRATVAGIVLRLEERGLVERVIDASNRRRKLCSVTAEGHSFLRNHVSEMQASQEALLQPLGKDERDTFLRLITKLVESNNGLGRSVLNPLAHQGRSSKNLQPTKRSIKHG